MKHNDLEDLFKDTFKDFEADVNPGTWKNIRTALTGTGLGIFGKFLLNKIGTNTLIAVVSSAATVIGTVFVMNTADTKKNTPGKTKEEPKVVAEATKPSVEEIKDFLKTENNTTPMNKNNTASVKEENKAKTPVSEESGNGTITVKKDKMKSVIKALSEGRVAVISSNIESGSVPLIVNLANSGTGKINKWTCNDGTKPMTGANPVKVFDTPGIYTIVLNSTSADGKTGIDSVKVEVYGNSSMMDSPEDFTPNGDGTRDEFQFKTVNMVSQEATVFSKNEKIVFHSNVVNSKWDGKTPKGELAPAGEYYYILTAVGVDGKKHKKEGKINLIR